MQNAQNNVIAIVDFAKPQEKIIVKPCKLCKIKIEM